MSLKNLILAKKYAIAYLDIYSNELDDQSILQIKKSYDYLKNNNSVIVFLSLPNISLYDKTNFINIFFNKFELHNSLKKLFFLLMKHSRILLLKDVFKQIINIYQIKKNIMIFDIASSAALDKNDSDIILKFLSSKTNKKILPIYQLNKELIAGIRLQSGSLIWESSIRKQLSRVKQLLYKR